MQWFVKNLWIAEIPLVLLFWFLVHLGVKKFLARSKLEILGKLFSIVVSFVSLLIILQILGLDIVPLVTFGGIGAAALGIASKDVVSNFFGALMVYATRPFIVGDLIEIPDKGIMGSVEEIGWYHTAIREVQKKPIYIPNSVFPTCSLINWSRMTHRRIDEVLRIRAEDADKVLSIVEEIRALLKSHPAIDSNQPIFVFFQSYKESSLELVVQAYTASTRYDEYMENKQKILLEIRKIIDKAGAEVASPAVRVQMQNANCEV